MHAEAGDLSDTLAEIEVLEAAVQEAIETGFVVGAFKARLALAVIERRIGKNAEARSRLEKLEADAHELGFVLIVTRAGDLLRSSD